MKLSLREARKLEARIQTKLNEGIITGRALNIHAYTLDTDGAVYEWLKETFQLGEDSVDTIIELISARSTIRRLIQSTNETVGINELISKRKELIRIRNTWAEVVEQYDSDHGQAMTGGVLQRMAQSAIESSKHSSSSYGRNDSITVSAVSDDLFELAGTKVRSLLRDIDHVEDKLAGLNASTKVELAYELAELLKFEDLL